MPLDFTAIDFETANSSPASACAVGLVKVRDGKLVETFAALFYPPEPYNWFSEQNIRVHGITPEKLIGSGPWGTVLTEMLAFIAEDVLIAHNAGFDIGVLRSSAAQVELDLPKIQYGCSLAIARKTYNLESYRLNAVAYAIGHEEFRHHDALADSDACARIIVHAANRHEVSDLMDLLKATKQALKTL